MALGGVCSYGPGRASTPRPVAVGMRRDVEERKARDPAVYPERAITIIGISASPTACPRNGHAVGDAEIEPI